MSLNKTILEDAIRAAFKKAKETPPPADPKDSDATQTQIIATLAQDLATAIHNYVGDAEVNGVSMKVSNSGGTLIGSGTQTDAVKLQ